MNKTLADIAAATYLKQIGALQTADIRRYWQDHAAGMFNFPTFLESVYRLHGYD